MTRNIGFTCAYTPIPLIEAAGFDPLRIFPESKAPDQAGHLLHDNLCPHVKKVLDRALASDLVLSSMCTVFAESEVVSLIASGTEQKEIALGLNRAIAARTNSLVKRVSKNQDNLAVSMSGGVARNKGVVKAIAESMNIEKVNTPEKPDIIGALGAAIIALERSA